PPDPCSVSNQQALMTSSPDNFHPSLSNEWLEADGLGGFASGTSTGIRTRRYHALLLTATTPPTGRMVLVNGFDAWIETPAVRFVRAETITVCTSKTPRSALTPTWTPSASFGIPIPACPPSSRSPTATISTSRIGIRTSATRRKLRAALTTLKTSPHPAFSTS